MYGYDPLTLDDPDEKRKRGTGTELADYLMKMAQLPAAAEEPEPITVSGSSVIGLSPDQTTRLLDRVQKQSQFESAMAREQNRTRERAIEGLNEKVFRAREMEDRRKESAAAKQEERAYQEQKAAETRALGQPIRMPDGSMAIQYVNPATGQWDTRSFADAAPKLQWYDRVNPQTGQREKVYGAPEVGMAVPQPGPNMQFRDYSVQDASGKEMQYRDVLNPATGEVESTQLIGPAPQSQYGLKPPVPPTASQFSAEVNRLRNFYQKQMDSGMIAEMPNELDIEEQAWGFLQSAHQRELEQYQRNQQQPAEAGASPVPAAAPAQGAWPAPATPAVEPATIPLAPGEFIGADGGVYRDDGDGFSTRVR